MRESKHVAGFGSDFGSGAQELHHALAGGFSGAALEEFGGGLDDSDLSATAAAIH